MLRAKTIERFFRKQVIEGICEDCGNYSYELDIDDTGQLKCDQCRIESLFSRRPKGIDKDIRHTQVLNLEPRLYFEYQIEFQQSGSGVRKTEHT